MSSAQETRDPLGLVGVTLDGQFDIASVVGEGGFGVVYKGRHRGLEQPVAIKVLKILSVEDKRMQEALFAKFRDEAKLLYTLSQESLNIVRAIHYGSLTTPSGLWAPYMVLEWLEGRSLAEDVVDRRQRGLRGRTLDEALAILEPVAAGLTVAHARKVAHRDIKPANVFLARAEQGQRVKVLDFGIAKLVQEGETSGTKSAFGAFTWLYAAPEQIDPRLGATGLATDVYAFALLATELLTDREPTDARDVVTLMKASQDPTIRPTPRQRGAQIPDDVEHVFRRALAVDPRSRFQNIAELWGALRATRGAPPTLRSERPSAVMPASTTPVSPAMRPSVPMPMPMPTPAPGMTPFTTGPHVPPHTTGPRPQVPPGYAPVAPHVTGPVPSHPQPMAPPGWQPRGMWPRQPHPDAATNNVVWLAVVAVIASLLLVGACGALKACAG